MIDLQIMSKLTPEDVNKTNLKFIIEEHPIIDKEMLDQLSPNNPLRNKEIPIDKYYGIKHDNGDIVWVRYEKEKNLIGSMYFNISNHFTDTYPKLILQELVDKCSLIFLDDDDFDIYARNKDPEFNHDLFFIDARGKYLY